ncbi:MAG: 2-amino-4-hydroxy-6-hydroxymethyldihydropteridine diphosphokinase, partial [Candidatus Methylumidiphilus sp.]
QPDYVNAVLAVATTLPQHALLAALQAIENTLGRVRGLRWGPRTVDLDILLYGDLRIADARLTVPHPSLAEREFVLYPLADIAPPDLPIPGQANLSALLAACPRRGLEEMSDG